MLDPDNPSYRIPFASKSSPGQGLHIYASVGGGVSHRFEIDTGSVGVVVPRSVLPSPYNEPDPSLPEVKLVYTSDDKPFTGQWVTLPVALGVPASGDYAGDYPTAVIEVFAVDDPLTFDRGMMGIGFGMPGSANAGPDRNPALHLYFQGLALGSGHIITSSYIEFGLNPNNTSGFALLQLTPHGNDWIQPTAGVTAPHLQGDMPFIMDTGISRMILWVNDGTPIAGVAAGKPFPPGIEIGIVLPAPVTNAVPVLQYSFKTGETTQPMSPTEVVWKAGNSINTGANVLNGADYLFDHANGHIGFRMPPANATLVGLGVEALLQ